MRQATITTHMHVAAGRNQDTDAFQTLENYLCCLSVCLWMRRPREISCGVCVCVCVRALCNSLFISSLVFLGFYFQFIIQTCVSVLFSFFQTFMFRAPFTFFKVKYIISCFPVLVFIFSYKLLSLCCYPSFKLYLFPVSAVP
jgi:hypothetical protein